MTPYHTHPSRIIVISDRARHQRPPPRRTLSHHCRSRCLYRRPTDATSPGIMNVTWRQRHQNTKSHRPTPHRSGGGQSAAASHPQITSHNRSCYHRQRFKSYTESRDAGTVATATGSATSPPAQASPTVVVTAAHHRSSNRPRSVNFPELQGAAARLAFNAAPATPRIARCRGGRHRLVGPPSPAVAAAAACFSAA